MSTLLSDPFFIVMSLALVAAIGYNIWQVNTRDRAWKQVMDQTGLQLEKHNKGSEHDQTLSGVYHHRKLTLADTNQPVYRNGKRRSDMFTNAATNLHVALDNPRGYKLTLHRSMDNKNMTPIGDDTFDHKFNVTCEPQDFAKNLLVSETLRQNLLKLNPGGFIQLNENELVYDQTGRVVNPDRIVFLFDLVCSLAGAVESYRA